MRSGWQMHISCLLKASALWVCQVPPSDYVKDCFLILTGLLQRLIYIQTNISYCALMTFYTPGTGRACMWPLHQRERCRKMAPSSGASPAMHHANSQPSASVHMSIS